MTSFLGMWMGREQFNAVRMSADGKGSTEPLLYFCPEGRNANESRLFWVQW